MFETWFDKTMIAIVVILVIVLVVGLAGIVVMAVQMHDNPPVCIKADDLSYQCRDYQVQQCVKDERYSREECIALVGGGK